MATTDEEHGLREECPDGGTCHHYGCVESCFRVRTCGPLSGVFPDDEWPDEVLAAHGMPARSVVLSPDEFRACIEDAEMALPAGDGLLASSLRAIASHEALRRQAAGGAGCPSTCVDGWHEGETGGWDLCPDPYHHVGPHPTLGHEWAARTTVTR